MLSAEQYTACGMNDEARCGACVGDCVQVLQRLLQRMTLDERVPRAAGEQRARKLAPDLEDLSDDRVELGPFPGTDLFTVLDMLTRQLRHFTEHRLLGSRREETLGFEIEVRNTKRQPIAIVVEDQVPRSTDDRIDVDLEERGGADFDDETGILRWRLGVAAGETERVRFRYEVTHPRDRRVVLE